MRTIFTLIFNRAASRVTLPYGAQAIGAPSAQAIKAKAEAYAAKNPAPRALYLIG